MSNEHKLNWLAVVVLVGLNVCEVVVDTSSTVNARSVESQSVRAIDLYPNTTSYGVVEDNMIDTVHGYVTLEQYDRYLAASRSIPLVWDGDRLQSTINGSALYEQAYQVGNYTSW